jgi:dihydrofolate reductase
MINIVAALSQKDRALGKNGELIFSIPEDMTRFKKLTEGHPVIMGRKTWESLPEKFRPLPNRTNIVITRDMDYNARGAYVVTSMEHALTLAKTREGADEIWIIGGGEIYSIGIPFADRLYLTLVNEEKDADSFFPPYDEFSKVLSEEHHRFHLPSYTFVTLERPSSNDGR